MIADFVSADLRWLRSPDGTQSTCVLFCAGKNQDRYFTIEKILAQLQLAITITKTHYPQFNHTFVYDNAPTHLKWAPNALSACKMPKFLSVIAKPGEPPVKIFGVDVNVLGPNEKPMHASDGSLIKECKQIHTSLLSDETVQLLYFPKNDPINLGGFKGMAEILREREYNKAPQLHAECPGFKCPAPGDLFVRCCCCWVLYNKPDFVAVESIRETLCKEHNVELLYLSKFHCELNPIEHCWSHAKRTYCLNPASSTEAALKRNMIGHGASLSNTEVSLQLLKINFITHHCVRYVIAALRYCDSYQKGLNSVQAAYSCQKFKEHWRVPEDILAYLDRV